MKGVKFVSQAAIPWGWLDDLDLTSHVIHDYVCKQIRPLRDCVDGCTDSPELSQVYHVRSIKMQYAA